MRDSALYPHLDRKGVVELILLTQILVLWPLFSYLPTWIRLVCLVVIALRFVMVRLSWKVPGRFVSGFFGLAGGAAIFLEFGTLAGRDAGVSLIALMFCLKLLEMRWYRDAALVLYLSFFIMVANFLFSQSLLMAIYMIICTLVVIIALQALHRTDGGVEMKQLLKSSSLIFVQAIPLILIFFLFFPRLSGPLWRMPGGLSGTTGISDSMTPGDIGSLVNFTEPAFRVEFSGKVPLTSELYWRGLVFSKFDGLTWSRNTPIIQRTADVQNSGNRYDYQILLEPHRRNWLYALEMPLSMKPYARTTTENTWERRFALRSRLTYQLTSYSSSRYGMTISAQTRAQNLSLPGNGNPQARLWAQQAYLDAGASSEDYIRKVLMKINADNYVYTLNPGVMASNMVDDFWFNKQKGYCEHYAGAFVFLMRAAGVPARVVTGYQGGKMNPFGDYMIVRQSNAHAWTEVWIKDKGWLRVDPTAAIHPTRVEVDLSEAWMQRDAIFDDITPGDWGQYSPDFLDNLQLYWDSLNNNWQRRFVGFDAASQHDLFSELGFPNLTMRDLANTMLILALIVMSITSTLFLRQRVKRDPIAKRFMILERKLTKLGFNRALSEGVADYITRVISDKPELEKQLRPILELYLSLRFRDSSHQQEQLKQFNKRVNGFKTFS